MATTNLITVTKTSEFVIQTGNGTPDHTSPQGSQYTDLDTGTTYKNMSGSTSWGKVPNVDSTAIALAMTASGTGTYTATVTPAITNYIADQAYIVTFTDANTGAATLNLNSLGARDIQRNGAIALKSGDIEANQTFWLIYDGTQFQIVGRVSTSWSPTAITLGDGVASGATLSLNSGAGIYVNFDSGSDDEYLFNVALPRNGIEYDGSEITMSINWAKFGASGGTVIWEIDYAFVNDGDDAYTVSDGTLTETVAVDGITNQTVVTTSFNAISGEAGDKILQLTFRRNSAGGGSDTYTGDAEIYGINLEV